MVQGLTTLLQPRRFLLLAGTVLTFIGLAGVTGLLGSISHATLFNPPYWINWVHLTFGIVVLAIAFAGVRTIQNFDTAFLAVLHAMCLDHFYVHGARSCLQISAKHHLPGNVAGLADLAAAKAIEARHAAWQAKLPEDGTQLWDALVRLSGQESLAPLFAHCAGLTVNAVREPHQPRREAFRHADRLAEALALDVRAAGWSTTVDNYLGRVAFVALLSMIQVARTERNAVFGSVS